MYYVYIIQSGSSKNPPIKIGMSEDPERRIQELQTGNPELLTIKARIPLSTKSEALSLESHIHNSTKCAKYYGEWFSSDRLNLKKCLGEWNGATGKAVKHKKQSPKDQVKYLKSRVKRLQYERDMLSDELERAYQKIDGTHPPVDWL